MNELRHTASTITDDDLARLYDDRDRAREALRITEERLRSALRQTIVERDIARRCAVALEQQSAERSATVAYAASRVDVAATRVDTAERHGRPIVPGVLHGQLQRIAQTLRSAQEVGTDG
ncbi:hypothetical protein [Stackebrandtia soli]|uniref:hypothetical protein n=1 Tax=Stackebrandtia soli TaxID=1892856 RepID=UPI0039EA2B48